MEAQERLARMTSRSRLNAEPGGSVFERIEYLMPTRYFRFYFLTHPESRATCWLPEGFSS